MGRTCLEKKPLAIPRRRASHRWCWPLAYLKPRMAGRPAGWHAPGCEEAGWYVHGGHQYDQGAGGALRYGRRSEEQALLEGIPIVQQILTYGGFELNDAYVALEWCSGPSSVLLVVRRPPNGSSSRSGLLIPWRCGQRAQTQ